MNNIEKLLLTFAAESCEKINNNEETELMLIEFEKKLPHELKKEYLDISQRLAYDEQKRENKIYIKGMRDCYKLIKLLEINDN